VSDTPRVNSVIQKMIDENGEEVLYVAPDDARPLERELAKTSVLLQRGIDRLEPLLDENDELRADLARVTAELEKEERRHEQTLTERDNAENALSQAYFLIIGESPEWSNNFGHNDAIDEIDDAQRLLREALASAKAERDAALADARRFEWSLPILCVQGDLGDAHALLLCAAFAKGLDGRAAIDAAMQERDDG